ncbi:MAG: TRAP transporter large permease subunit, partial [Pseudomonadota bacterium]
AAAAILPNVMPPSIALLLAATATDLSVASLWLSGAGAAVVLAAGLVVAVRLVPPPGVAATKDLVRSDPIPRPAHAEDGWKILRPLVPLVLAAIAILSAMRLGVVTAVEAGLLAFVLAAIAAWRRNGATAVWSAIAESALNTGRILLLVAAAAPVAFLIAVEAPPPSAWLPDGGPILVFGAAIALALLLGTFLDAGAAILLTLPVLVPPLAVAGVDPVHAALTLTIALLIGGLTPPVGVLILVVKDVTGATGVYRAAVPFLGGLVAALALVALVPLLA